jgi:hypothetical protein
MMSATIEAPTKRQRREAQRRFKDAARAARQPRTPLGVIAAAEAAVRQRDEERARQQPRKLSRSALERAEDRGQITARQREAGERLYRDWHLSGSQPRVIAKLDGTGGGTGDDTSVKAIDARERFKLALQALGPELSPVVVHVCLVPQESPLTWDIEARRRKGTGNELLRRGLQRLVEWYGR